MLDEQGNEIKFIVPIEMTTKVKIIWKLTFPLLIYILIVVSFCLNVIPQFVYAPLKVPAILFTLFVSWFWISPSPTNPQKANWQRLLFFIIRNKQVFHPMPYYTAEEITVKPVSDGIAYVD